MQEPQSPDEFQRHLYDHKIDFLDFGCSVGGSLKYGVDILGGKRGLGIDVDPKKLELARKAGHRVVNFDIGQIPPRKMVEFTVMLHFLEHVPSPVLARDFITKACQVSKNFVLIRQPNFDADAYLLRQGLKLYCSDWHGHPNMMSSLEFFRILRDLKAKNVLQDFSLFGRSAIHSSDDKRIHSLNSPQDTEYFDPKVHPPKPQGMKFDQPVFFEVVALIELSEFNRKKLVKGLKVSKTLYQSNP